MAIKINRETKISAYIILALFISMQLEVSRMILLALLIAVFFLSEKTNPHKMSSKYLLTVQRICEMIVFALAVFTAIQLLVLGLGLRGIAEDVGVLSCVFIGFIIGAIGLKGCDSFHAYLKAILIFVIAFSVYYIIDIVLNGLPEGRNSVLGNVSSNFCSTILYLNYPVILYFLFGRDEDNSKHANTVKACYIALALSLVVIVTSGSRTAMGAVAVMVGQMIFLKQKKLKSKIKYFAIVIAGLISSLVAYLYIPSIRELLNRALDVLNGKKTLDTNVRQLIWASALEQFEKGDQFWGAGSSIVVEFERSVHNLYYEILLCSGYFGVLIFGLFFFGLIILLMKRQRYQQRFFSVMLLVSGFLVALVQPFFSTSYTCGIMFWMSLFVLTCDSRRKKL